MACDPKVLTRLVGYHHVEDDQAPLRDPPWTPDRMSDDAKFILGFG